MLNSRNQIIILFILDAHLKYFKALTDPDYRMGLLGQGPGAFDKILCILG